MEAITELTQLQVGNKIYEPKLKKDFVIVDYKYSEIYKEMVGNLEPTEKNDNGFQITLSSLIALEYEVY